MNAYKLALLSWYAFAGLLNVATIGKPVKPKTPSMAVVAMLVLGVLAFLVVRA